jgi:light-independent protochlorophyllide reductase subunit B
VVRLVESLGIRINTVAPLGASPADLARIPQAHFNIVLYPEIADTAARWLKRQFGQEMVTTVPIGVGATRDFVTEVAKAAGVSVPSELFETGAERLSWYSASIDSNYLTGKRVFVFGDATHAIAAARIASEELGFKVCGLGTYSREFARDVREAAAKYGVEPLISDNHLDVEDAIIAAQPELVLGTQMERHAAKRLRLPCAVISSPVHVQDFPARYSPQMGFEGANVIFDSWVHPLMMGLEEHLLQMFRGDFEFHDDAGSSHLSHGGPAGAHQPDAQAEQAAAQPPAPDATAAPVPAANDDQPAWTSDAERELRKIPFFVRGKARRNTESYAAENGLNPITIETLYDAKAHFGR